MAEEIWQPLLVIQDREELKYLPDRYLGMRFVVNGESNPSRQVEGLRVGEIHVSDTVMTLGMNSRLFETLVRALTLASIHPSSAFRLAM